MQITNDVHGAGVTSAVMKQDAGCAKSNYERGYKREGGVAVGGPFSEFIMPRAHL